MEAGKVRKLFQLAVGAAYVKSRRCLFEELLVAGRSPWLGLRAGGEEVLQRSQLRGGGAGGRSYRALKRPF